MDYTKHLTVAEHLAHLMDDQFKLGKFSFGLDPVIGLVPVVGDLIPLLLTAYILWISRQIEAPVSLQVRIASNAIVDALVGMIPVVGDLLDFMWKGHAYNVQLLRDHLAKRPMEGRIVSVTPVTST